MIPAHLYLFSIKSIPHLVFTTLLCGALLFSAALIALLVFEMKRRRGMLALCDWVHIKHRMLLLAVILSSLLFLQTYLAIGVILFFLFFSPRFLEADFRILQLEEYPTRQRPAERRRNRVAIELAQSVQASTKCESTSLFFERYRSTCEKITASEAGIFSGRRVLHNLRIGGWLLPAALLATLAEAAKAVALFPLESIFYDTATAFPLIFLMINAILDALVFFGGLIYGSIRWEEHFPSTHRHQLTVFLIIFTVLFVILIVITGLGLC